MNDYKILAFGDETGLLPVLEALKPSLIVYDPNRKGMADFCRKTGIRSMPHPQKNRLQEFEALIATSGIGLGVVSSYGRILSTEIINAFPCGIVNLHLSRLPEYRGANTLQWTIINGATETAATLHYIDEGIDTGPVVASKSVIITPDDDALSLQKKLIDAGRILLKTWLPILALGKVEADPQDEEKAKYWPRRSPEDGRIDLNWDAQRIVNMTRALVPPWPGAYFIDSLGNKVIIDRALSLEETMRLKKSHGAKA